MWDLKEPQSIRHPAEIFFFLKWSQKFQTKCNTKSHLDNNDSLHMWERLNCKQDWRHSAITVCFLFKLMKDYIHREEPRALPHISCSLSFFFWKRRETENLSICIGVYAPCSILDKCCVNMITTFTKWFTDQVRIGCIHIPLFWKKNHVPKCADHQW